MKTCLVIRHGALGDALMASCVLPYLHKDGYEITFLGNSRAKEVLKGNPYIKNWINHKDHSVPLDELEVYWEKKGEDFDKVVNLTGVVENDMLFSYPSDQYYMPLRKRRELVAGKNYFDAHLKRAGYERNGIIPNAEVYFSKKEKEKAKAWRARKSKFKILWALTGSSHHKICRYFEPVSRAFLDTYPDSEMYTTGDYPTKLLTYDHPKVTNTMLGDNFSFRDALLLAKNVDLIIGPETGLLVGASGFDVPKIALLTHSSPENLTKYWLNVHPIQAHCYCSPCHLLFKYSYIWQHVCQIDDSMGIPTAKCTEHGAGYIYERMVKTYDEWRSKI